jgi:hypothetical protein
MHMKNNISITKVTHGGRDFTVKTARENGATVTGVVVGVKAGPSVL